MRKKLTIRDLGMMIGTLAEQAEGDAEASDALRAALIGGVLTAIVAHPERDPSRVSNLCKQAAAVIYEMRATVAEMKAEVFPALSPIQSREGEA